MTDIERILKEYRFVKKRIHSLELELAEIEAKKEAEYDHMIKAQRMKPDKVTGGIKPDPIVDTVSKVIDVYGERQKKIAANLAAANGKLAFIEDIVAAAGLDEIELRYVRLRYFEGMKVWKVAEEIGYSESRARDYKRIALAKIEEAM